MAKQLGFWFEADKCVECYACQVACKAKSNVDLGVAWRRVVNIWGGSFPNVTLQSISLSCMHCGSPACVAVCPVGAIKKAADTGIVTVDRTKCIGCHQCFQACPFGVPQFGKDGTMQKCDMCQDRLAAGKEPMCVSTCPASALHVGTMEDLAKAAQEKAAQKLGGATTPSVIITK
jgi:anaerobic dimethyl sulfoxide reductase subunit B